MRIFTCPRCKTRMRREAGPANGELLCPPCAYQSAGSRKTAELAFQLGEHHAALGQQDKALAAFAEALQLNPEHASAYAGRGGVYLAKNDYPRAVHQYTEAVRRGLADATLYVNRGKCFVQQKDPRSAEADFTAAIRLAPQSVWAYRSRGHLYLRQEQNDKAVADLTEAIRLDSAHAQVYNLRALAYFGKGDYDKAVADFNQAIDLGLRDAQTYCLLGKSHFHKRNFDKAITALTEAIRLDPRYADAYQARGGVFFAWQKVDAAMADYTEAIRINPDMAEAYSNRALCYLSLRNYDAALANLAAAARLDPQSAEVRRRMEVVRDAKDHQRKTVQKPDQRPTVTDSRTTVPAVVFSCPSCRERLQVSAQQAGKTVRCPSCRGSVIVPGSAPPQSRTPAPALQEIELAPSLREFEVERPDFGMEVEEADAERKYHYRRAGICYGPYSGKELRELAEAGNLRRSHEVQKNGWSGWKRAGDVKGLFPEVETSPQEQPMVPFAMPVFSQPLPVTGKRPVPPPLPSFISETPAYPVSKPAPLPDQSICVPLELLSSQAGPMPPPLPPAGPKPQPVDDRSICLPDELYSGQTGPVPPPLPSSGPPPLPEGQDTIMVPFDLCAVSPNKLQPPLPNSSSGPPPLPSDQPPPLLSSPELPNVPQQQQTTKEGAGFLGGLLKSATKAAANRCAERLVDQAFELDDD